MPLSTENVWFAAAEGHPGSIIFNDIFLSALWSKPKHELRNEVRDIVRETGIETIPIEKKCKKAKCLSGDTLQIAVKRREAKSKGKRKDISMWLQISKEY